MSTESESKPELEFPDADFADEFLEIDDDFEFDMEKLMIIDDSPSRSTEIVLHYDVSAHLQASGFEDLHLQFIPDNAVPSTTFTQISAPNKEAIRKIEMCPSCGRSYQKPSYLKKHLQICRRSNSNGTSIICLF